MWSGLSRSCPFSTTELQQKKKLQTLICFTEIYSNGASDDETYPVVLRDKLYEQNLIDCFSVSQFPSFGKLITVIILLLLDYLIERKSADELAEK